jgi:hypothetical protein
MRLRRPRRQPFEGLAADVASDGSSIITLTEDSTVETVRLL